MANQQQTGGPRPRSGARRVLATVGKIVGTVFLTAFLAFLIFACLFAVYVKNDLSVQAEWDSDGIVFDQTSVIYYEDRATGKYEVLKTLYGGSNSTWVKYEDIPKNLIHACIAIEDKRFEKHQGVDWVTTLRACFKMFIGKSEAGGSTITQQFIKNATGDREVTVRRKVIEIYRALEYEKTHTKDQIMEGYLNIIPLGENCRGVQSASRVYFGKDVKDLSLAECASLIGITNNPSLYDPYLNPEKNKERQVVILSEMLKQGYINQTQHDEAVAEELVFSNASRANGSDDNGYYSWFEDQVINDVVSDLCDKTGYEYKLVYEMVRTGGYQIYATIDPDVQAAVDAVYEDLSSLPATASSQQLQSGIVIVDNTTGDIVALAGGVGKKQGSLIWNCATQSLLSPGSIIKPVSVYAPAIELGLITPATVLDDTPYSFTDTATWPKNLDETYRGLESVEEAVARSTNTIPVKLAADMTPEYCYSFAKDKMGLSTLVSSYTTAGGEELSDVNLWAMALGSLTRGVTVRAMTAAYATFANEGVYRAARTYTVVKDSNGQVILDNTQSSQAAMKDMTAWYITSMLENTVQTGTGTAAQLDNMTVAGKTGTTSRDFDRWFAGYTPYYTGVVWCGYNDPEEIVLTDSDTNPSIVMWKKVMERVHEGLKNKAFKQPTGLVEVTVCRDSGLLPSDACALDPRGSRTVRVTLSAHDVPTEQCTVHKTVDICDASGHVANEFCALVPGNGTHKVALLDVSRAFPKNGVIVLDQAYAILKGDLPAGYYAAVSPDVDSINVECYVHDEEDLPEPEPEEEEDDPFSDTGLEELPPTD